MGAAFVARTLLKNLKQDELPLPVLERWQGGPTTFPLKKLGIGHPVLMTTRSVVWQHKLEVDDDEEAEKPADGDEKSAKGKDKKGKSAAAKPVNRGPMPAGGGLLGADADKPKKKWIDAPRYEFVVQFCWQVPPPETMVELTQLYPGAVGLPDAAAAEMAADEEEADDASEEGVAGASDEPAADGETDGAAPAMENDEAAADAKPPAPNSAGPKPAPDATKNEEK